MNQRLAELILMATLLAPVWGADLTATPSLPAGFRLVYEQHFDSPQSRDGFAFSDPNAWIWTADGQSMAMELASQSRYQPPFRSPLNLAIIADFTFGDFVLEADLIQTGKEYGHRDMCVFYGIQDPAHFYYTHIATKADPNAHNTFIVNGGPRTNIALATTSGVNWGLGVWHHIRLERNISSGTIRVYFDDMKTPIMQAEDRTFGVGWIGFGSFDDTGKVDNIRVWAPQAPETRPIPFFQRSK